MATDAEITLNFKAEIQEALKAIHQLRDEIEKIKAAGGFLSPEDIELISEMKAKLDEYTRTVRELQIEYYRLQQRSGEMSAEFFAQVTNLRKQIMELQAQMSTLNDRLADQGVQIDKLKEKVKELQEGHRKTEENGIHAYRSLRTAIGHFIVNLAKGKLAVRELGLALKGLAYSTVVLGAIQLAMDGIMWAWKGIKSMFGQSEEEMKAAEEAAERAKEALNNAHAASVKAGEEYQALKDKFDKDNSAKQLKENAERIAELFAQQRKEQEKTLGLMQIQAELEARAIKDRAERESHEIRLQGLELKRKKLMEEISDEEYENQMAELGMRERGAMRQGRVDAAATSVQNLEAQRQDLERRLADARTARGAAETAQRGRVSDNDLALIESDLKYARSRVTEARQRMQTAVEIAKAEGRPTLGTDYNQGLQDKDEWSQRVKQLELYYEQQKKLNEGYSEGAKFLEQQDKLIGELSQKANEVEEKLTTAKRKLKETEEDTFMEALRDEEISDSERSVRKAEIENNKRKKQRQAEEKARKEQEGEQKRKRNETQKIVDQVTKETLKLATDKDKTNDTQAFRMIGELLETNGKAIRQYGVNVSELLKVCAALDLQGKNADAKMATMEAKIRQLQRQVDKRTAKP
ncbi:MAG: hypothetical protein Q4C88_06745 [Akkermansia sp.]|nr:hypothetical protein [Akkermansia sp.]